jgi:hypothetical protein
VDIKARLLTVALSRSKKFACPTHKLYDVNLCQIPPTLRLAGEIGTDFTVEGDAQKKTAMPSGVKGDESSSATNKEAAKPVSITFGNDSMSALWLWCSPISRPTSMVTFSGSSSWIDWPQAQCSRFFGNCLDQDSECREHNFLHHPLW